MSDRKDALTDMLAMVDARVGIQPEKRCYTEKFCSLFDRCFDEALFDLFSAGYEGSLDAAKALHEAVLPGWRWRKASLPHKPLCVEVISPVLSILPEEDWAGFETHEGDYNDPARAWLVAILKALIAQED